MAKKYRITVEMIDGEPEELSKWKKQEFEGTGYVFLIYEKGESSREVVEDLTTVDIAQMIAGTNIIYQSSIIAKAFREAAEVDKKYSLSKRLTDALKNAMA